MSRFEYKTPESKSSSVIPYAQAVIGLDVTPPTQSTTIAKKRTHSNAFDEKLDQVADASKPKEEIIAIDEENNIKYMIVHPEIPSVAHLIEQTKQQAEKLGFLRVQVSALIHEFNVTFDAHDALLEQQMKLLAKDCPFSSYAYKLLPSDDRQEIEEFASNWNEVSSQTCRRLWMSQKAEKDIHKYLPDLVATSPGVFLTEMEDTGTRQMLMYADNFQTLREQLKDDRLACEMAAVLWKLYKNDLDSIKQYIENLYNK